MNKIKGILIKTGVFAAVFLAVLYILFLTVLNRVLSSPRFLSYTNEFITQKTGIVITSENLNVKTYPSLNIYISAENFNLNSGNNELLRVKNASLTYDIKRLKPVKADIEYIYLNQQHLKNVVKTHKNKKTSDFKPKKLPDINVKKAEIWAEKDENKTVFIKIDNLKIKNSISGKIKCTFEAEITSNMLKHPILAGKNGYIYLEHDKLIAQDLELLTGASKLSINGKLIDGNKKSDFSAEGENIPVSDVMTSLLYFQKLKDKSKKFIENFYDYNGKMNVDLKITQNGIWGECLVKNLSGKTVLFNVPVLFPEVPFKFKGREFSGGALGILGGEKVYADFDLTDMGTSKQQTKGTVQAILTNKSVGKYVPNASVKGKTDASVNWHIKNKKIDVNYNLYIPKDSDISYLDAYLGLLDKNRHMHVETLKEGDKLKITNYEYTMEAGGNTTKIIMGSGLFQKHHGHFEPDYITCRTENNAPVSVAASFYKYLQGGVFNGNLRYDFKKNKITGNFDIKDSVYKHYKIKEAKVIATPFAVKIDAEGSYKKSPFNASISGLNNFNDKLRIYNIYLFLDELRVNTNKAKKNHPKPDEKKIKSQIDNFDIDLFTIKLNKLKYNNAFLTNILLTGNIQDNIFNFEVPHTNFANGLLKAKGLYNFNNRTSDVTFYASNIDANIAAGSLFNLHEQVMGTADAILKAKTKNGITDREGHLDFSIKEGYLPKLGSTEFMVKQAKLMKKSYTLEDIVNIDIKNIKALASDIKGCYDYSNGKITNAKITSSQKYLSLFILGDYDTINQDADIKLFGKYNNKEISKIKIFFVPLSFVVKILFRPEKTMDKYSQTLKNVPEISAQKEADVSYFRVSMKGNINKNKLNVEMKSIL